MANGECLEYSLSPDSSIEEVIYELACGYVQNQCHWIPDQVLVEPYIFRKLEEQMNEKYNHIRLLSFVPPAGFTQLVLQTPVGPLKVVPVPDLEFPIFIGRHEEYKDNAFNALFEELLIEGTIHRRPAPKNKQVRFGDPVLNMGE